MNGAGADLDLAVPFANSREARDASDVDEDLGLAEAKLHEWDEAVAARDQFAGAVGGPKLRQRIVERSSAVVLECRCDHAWPP
jgi:hypothetical protein